MPLVPHSTRHGNNNRATKTATERSTKNRNQRAEAKLKTQQSQTEAGIVLNHLHFLLLLFCLCNQFSIIYVIIRGNRIWCRNRNRGSLALMPTIHSSRTLHLFNICVNASLTQLSLDLLFLLLLHPVYPLLMNVLAFLKPVPPTLPFHAVAQNKGQAERHLNHYSQHKARAKQTRALPETSSRLRGSSGSTPIPAKHLQHIYKYEYKYKSKSFQFVCERVVHC